MNYRPPHFIIQELVDPEIFERLGDGTWGLLDERALRALESVREKFGPITVNNWHRGGRYKESGLRRSDTTTGAPKSAHKQGKAFDCKPSKISVHEMYHYIINNPDEFPLIRRVESIEYATTWVHLDTVEHPGKGIRVFNP